MRTSAGFSLGVGLPLRSGILPWIGKLQSSGDLAFCEVNLEALMRSPQIYSDYIDTLINCGVEICLHSVGILPGANFDQQIKAVNLLCSWCSPSLLSVHVADSFGIGLYGESFARQAYSREFFSTMESHIGALTSVFNLPIAIENISSYRQYSETSIDEIDFLDDLARSTGVNVIFDVSNHLTTYGDSVDKKQTALAVKKLPLQYIHISGGRWLNGHYIDTHSDPIPEAHLDFCAELVSFTRSSLYYERDSGFERAQEIDMEICGLLRLAKRAFKKAEKL